MPLSFIVIELSAYAFGILFTIHAHKEGLRWLSTLLWGMVFGTAIELLLLQAGGYSYGKFLIMLGPAGKQVPLWVGVGWGVIAYAASWTAQRLRQPTVLRATTAGVLAVNIDLSLDPIAELLGFWSWAQPKGASFYDVPFDNFLGWFAIVSLFSFAVRALFRLFKPGRVWIDILVPGLGAALAVGGMLLLGEILPIIYKIAGGQLIPFLIILGLAGVSMWHAAFRTPRDLPPAKVILALPLYMHCLLFILFLTSTAPRDDGLVTLAVLIPQNLAAGFFAYAWVSLSKLFVPKSA